MKIIRKHNEIKDDISAYIEKNTGAKINEIVVGKNQDNKYSITFNTKENIVDKWSATKLELNKKYQDYTFNSSIISSNVAKNTFYNALKSMLWAILAIIAYISARFRWSYSIAAIIALIHDSLIVYAIFALLRLEINVAFYFGNFGYYWLFD